MMIFSTICLGAFGVWLRFIADHSIKITGFPLSTLLVNVVGCFIAGWVFSSPSIGETHRTPILIGLCGGLTTFSALILQSLQMMKNGQTGKAFIYLFISLTAGFFAAWAGLRLKA